MEQPLPPCEGKEAPFPYDDSVKTLTVGILLCTFNGGAYLREQLESFIAQTYSHWCLFVSDDGSTDQTLTLLNEYRLKLGSRLMILEGPQRGFAQNFMSLIRNDNIKCDAYAFSDQDDIWLADKLERSLAALAPVPKHVPSLYCSRTRLIDTDGRVTGLTPLFKKRPSFKNALVQSLAGANTMLINDTARDLLARTDVDAPIIAHDWLAYLIVSGCGGTVIYDAEPTVLYRQHAGNLIGANAGLRNKLVRIRKMLGGRFKTWNEKNLFILSKYSSALTPENRCLIAQFERLRGPHVVQRISSLRDAGFYRQTVAGTVSLYAAVVLRQV
jgi:glycosyltransferase involved in cell wall biosynthesis